MNRLVNSKTSDDSPADVTWVQLANVPGSQVCARRQAIADGGERSSPVVGVVESLGVAGRGAGLSTAPEPRQQHPRSKNDEEHDRQRPGRFTGVGVFLNGSNRFPTPGFADLMLQPLTAGRSENRPHHADESNGAISSTPMVANV